MKKPLALVIEDNQDLAFVFKAAVEAAGYEAEIIGDGAKALERLLHVVPRLVILDLQLPHVSGESLLQQFTADTRLLNCRVMVVTANAIAADVLRSKADIVMIKPVTFSQVAILQSVLVLARPPKYLKNQKSQQWLPSSQRLLKILPV